jgi:hypothetical protein
MTDSQSAQDRAPTTEQIAAAGTVGSKDGTSPGQRPLGDVQTEQPTSATQAAADNDPGRDDQPHAQLLADDELQSIHGRWKDIQAEFVDEPRMAVQDADALVAELM